LFTIDRLPELVPAVTSPSSERAAEPPDDVAETFLDFALALQVRLSWPTAPESG
jgi:hypothetical protein